MDWNAGLNIKRNSEPTDSVHKSNNSSPPNHMKEGDTSTSSSQQLALGGHSMDKLETTDRWCLL